MTSHMHVRKKLDWPLLLALVVGTICTGGPNLVADDATDHLRAIQKRFNAEVRPMLKTSCGECHWGDNDDAGLNLERFETIDQLLDARKIWRKVLTRVSAREMPPEGSPPLSDSQHRDVMEWIDELLNSVDCTNINPGRTTIRRLNRTEYQNTIRDLLGVQYEPAQQFPGDDLGYGFDNIADVLSLPPRLLEKYLDAAESIAGTAVGNPANRRVRKTIKGIDFRKSNESQVYDNLHMIFSNGSITHAINVPTAGKYQITVNALADQAGNEPAEMGIGIVGQVFKSIAVKTRSRTPRPYKMVAQLKTGRQRLQISFLNDHVIEATDTSKRQDRNLYIHSVSIKGPLEIKRTSSSRLLGKTIPKNKADQTALAQKVLKQLMSRAFRRPVAASESQRMMQLYESSMEAGRSFHESMQLCVQAMLVSPHFIYKVERPAADASDSKSDIQQRSVSQFELATRLSYFLWSTMPDDELFELAWKGKLDQPDELRKQIDRMLTDPKASALVDNFAAQWLKLPGLLRLRPDPDLFSDVDMALREDMIKETSLLISDLIAKDASVLRILDVDYSFVNQRLAEHYGIEGIAGEEFQKVNTRDVGRVGVISHASILTLTSNPTRTSPVKRGKWIMENLLGDEPPPPDPKAIPLDDQKELTGTVRERTIQHRADPNCAVCHLVMDELGFALENFDAVGRWRTEDAGQQIDARGELPDGTKFEGAQAMQIMLQTKMKDKFVRCLTEKMLIYALGRGLEYFDECTVDEIMEHLETNDYRFSELISAIVLSDPFRRSQQATTPAAAKDQSNQE